ncbi:hypothetical protein DM02DRAFT_658541 [Periconia macrospinosa]|uniref:Uncharacterized protein n=1 Tax=Periconia macrospinosa TaxID=97972 RepID=A0A2V1DG20_9PLEO|nr:hypothetical protein DM02DRAFT_658541 [Periconia macrospinosa]
MEAFGDSIITPELVDSVMTPEFELEWIRFARNSEVPDAEGRFAAFLRYMDGDEIPKLSEAEWDKIQHFESANSLVCFTNYAGSSLEQHHLRTIMDSSKKLGNQEMSWFVNWIRSQCSETRFFSPRDLTVSIDHRMHGLGSVNAMFNKAGFGTSARDDDVKEIWILYNHNAWYLARFELATRTIKLLLCSKESHHAAIEAFKEWVEAAWQPVRFMKLKPEADFSRLQWLHEAAS